MAFNFCTSNCLKCLLGVWLKVHESVVHYVYESGQLCQSSRQSPSAFHLSGQILRKIGSISHPRDIRFTLSFASLSCRPSSVATNSCRWSSLGLRSSSHERPRWPTTSSMLDSMELSPKQPPPVTRSFSLSSGNAPLVLAVEMLRKMARARVSSKALLMKASRTCPLRGLRYEPLGSSKNCWSNLSKDGSLGVSSSSSPSMKMAQSEASRVRKMLWSLDREPSAL